MTRKTSTPTEELESLEIADAVESSMRLPPVHPGRILKEDFLVPLGISESRLARETFLLPTRINKIVRGERGVTADTALRLARFFGTSAQFWLNLQNRHDLERSRDDAALQAELDRIRLLRESA